MYCPKCGEKLGENYSSPQVPVGFNTCATIGFVLSIVSFSLSFCGLMPLAAMVVSAVGYDKARQRGERGQGLATAGIIVSFFSLIIALACLIFMLKTNYINELYDELYKAYYNYMMSVLNSMY